MIDRRDAGRQPGHYRLFVRGLELPLRVGVHGFERDRPQRVRVDIELWVRRAAPADDDRLAGVVDYEKVVDGIRHLAQGGHINLLETLAERIADVCFADARVLGAKVAVEKPDIFPDSAGVGVEIERWRD